MEQPINPFELQQPPPPPQWSGLMQLTPQEGGMPQQQSEVASYHALSPEIMNLLWAPQQQPPPLY